MVPPRVLRRDDPQVLGLPLSDDRFLPAVATELGPQWAAALGPTLRFPRCTDCGRYLHPPVAACRRCHGRRSALAAVSGRGVVHACTVNHQRWEPELPVPYAIAVVELEEQAGLRLTSNVIGVAPDEVRIGLPVRVAFVDVGRLYIPVFEPAGGADA